MGCSHFRSSKACTIDKMPRRAHAVAREFARSATRPASTAAIVPRLVLCAKEVSAQSLKQYWALVRGR